MWTKWILLVTGVLFFAFFVADEAVTGGSMEHFTQWTFLLHTVVLFMLAASHKLAEVKTKSPLMRDAVKIFDRLTLVWFLPATIAIEASVAIGSTVMEELSPIAKQAILEFGEEITWTYNAAVHFLTFLILMVYVTFEFTRVCLLTNSLRGRSPKERGNVILFTLIFFISYVSFFDPRHVYQISLARSIIVASMIATQVASLLVYFACVEAFFMFRDREYIRVPHNEKTT